MALLSARADPQRADARGTTSVAIASGMEAHFHLLWQTALKWYVAREALWPLFAAVGCERAPQLGELWVQRSRNACVLPCNVGLSSACASKLAVVAIITTSTIIATITFTITTITTTVTSCHDCGPPRPAAFAASSTTSPEL